MHSYPVLTLAKVGKADEIDLIWGRLDAAEVIVRTLLPEKDNSNELTPEAEAILDDLCKEIIVEEMHEIRQRRMGDIDQTLFCDSDQKRIKEVLDELDQMKLGDAEQYFRTQYTVGREALSDLPMSYVFRTGAKSMRTLSRLLKRMPAKLPKFGARVLSWPIATLNTAFETLYWLQAGLDKSGCFHRGSKVRCVVVLQLLVLLVGIVGFWLLSD